MSYDPYKALYIHIPFCKKRCDYCDFVSKECKRDSQEMQKYIDNLLHEIREASSEGKLSQIETVYIGGGTPTHLGNKLLVELVYFLSTTLFMKNIDEFTIEANPESLTEQIVKDVYALGVNRVSIGVQSFDDDMLKTLGRVHDSNEAKRAILDAKSRFSNVSIDLMCGLPNQTIKSWINDLEIACELDIQHISVYPLTIEKRTSFYKKCMIGKMDWPDEDLQAEMMSVASSVLKDFGFTRYEVASYSKAGFESKHNCAYWTGVPYIGFGKSAVTMTQNENKRMRFQDGIVTDDLNKKQMRAEDIMLKFRMTRAISNDEVEASCELLPELKQTLKELEAKGLIENKGKMFCPTEKGWLCGNELYGKIFDLA